VFLDLVLGVIIILQIAVLSVPAAADAVGVHARPKNKIQDGGPHHITINQTKAFIICLSFQFAAGLVGSNGWFS
jgi:hypothetical protein